jgi:hypothetical protein
VLIWGIGYSGFRKAGRAWRRFSFPELVTTGITSSTTEETEGKMIYQSY